MKNLQLLLAIVASLFAASPAFAGGSEPSSKAAAADEKGTNLKGQSSDFKDYLNSGEGEEKESNSLELADLGEDAKLAVGGDDPSLGVKVGY